MTLKHNDLAFSLEAEPLAGFTPDEASLHLTAKIMRATDDGLRGISWSSSYSTEPGHELADLTVSGWANTDWEHTYGWGVAIHDPYDVDLDRAKAIVRVLGRIGRRLDKLAEPYGRNGPQSFTDYLLRVAEILEVRQFGVWGERRPNGTRPWRLLDGPAHAATWLGDQLDGFRDQYPTKPQQEAADG